MSGESVNDKVSRVRPPRVHITYQVDVGGAMVMKELPFVMGVLGEFSSNPKQLEKKLKERDFIEVNQQNLDSVLKDMAPQLKFTVPNKLSSDPDAGALAVDVTIESMADFAPDRVAQQVEPLRKLLELRARLADLRSSLQGNDKLDAILQEMLANEGAMARLQSELATDGGRHG
jgi:type VI secretion system protein ImpB